MLQHSILPSFGAIWSWESRLSVVDNGNSLPIVGNFDARVNQSFVRMQAFKSPVSWIKLNPRASLFAQRIGPRFRKKNLRTKLLATAYVNVTLWLLKQQLFKLVGGPQKKCR